MQSQVIVATHVSTQVGRRPQLNMRSFYAQFWPWQSSASLRKAVVVSIVLHAIVVTVLTVRFPQTFTLTQAGMYSIELMNPNAPPSSTPPLGDPAAKAPANPQPPAPPPPPPPPPKKDEPKAKEPEPKREEPKPVKKADVEKPKEEKPKKEVARDEKKKDDKKKDKNDKKTDDKPVKLARNDNPLADVADSPLDDLRTSSAPTRPTRKQAEPVPGIASGKPGLQMAGGVPSALGMWGGLVQRKVEKEWVVPEGIQLGPVDDGALISFWVSNDGQLIGEPEVVKQALDSAVAISAIKAIKSAVPFPALPETYGDAKVQVYYTFIPTK